MKKIFYLSITLIVLSGIVSCRKYVEIDPEQTRPLKTTTEYEMLLYNANLLEPSYTLPLFSGDDIGSDEIVWQNSLGITQGNAYTWAENYFGTEEEDSQWSALYRQMYIYNLVVNGVMDSDNGPDALKRKVLAYAKVHRAYTYLVLVNMYAPQYDAATAASDPGVPMLLTPSFTGSLKRATVQEVYEQIVKDLTEALGDLPAIADVKSNPSQSAAYGLLARAYLNMRDFTNAQTASENALALNSNIVDLNAYAAAPATYPTKLVDPEAIFLKRTALAPTFLPVSSHMLSLFDVNDIRYKIFTMPASSIQGAQINTGRGYFKYRLRGEGIFIGPTVPEMILIRAECLARKNQFQNAMDVVNSLRIKRFPASAYTPFNAADASAALSMVMNERERELMGTGSRWFDQRRLSKDQGLIGTVARTFKSVSYSLEPGSNRYVYPIAPRYITMNPEIVQNPR